LTADVITGLLAPDPHGGLTLTDRHHRGTNGLLLAPPNAIEPSFGGDSRAAHEACARDTGARYVELDGPLSLDLDTPDDLLLVESLVDDPIEVLETADAG
jgi:2-phospho-L-lactate guanylyltransferase (CobY/MobA/RfbA family)